MPTLVTVFAAAWGLHRDVTVLDVREYSLMVTEKETDTELTGLFERKIDHSLKI
jgi:uncharacterized protein (DUF1697 family)